MHANRLDALFLGANDHRLQVIDVAVHVAVGEEADEVDDAATGLGTGDDLLPGFALPDGAGGNSVSDERCTLAVDLTGANGVMADFGIAHILVGRHADSSTVGAQGDVRIVGEQLVQRRLACGGDGAACVRLGDAVAIHDDRDHRALNAGEGSKFLQHDVFLRT